MRHIPDVLLVHGGPGAIGSLHPMAIHLSRYHNVLECIQTKYSVTELKDELRTQIGKLPVPSVTLVGHSWGAWLVMMVAVEHPELVDRLILIGCPPFEEKYVSLILENRLSHLHERDKIRFMEIMAELKRKVTEHTLHLLEQYVMKTDNYHLVSDEVHSNVDRRMYEAVWGEAEIMRRRGDLKKMLFDIKCPVTVIHGDYDPHPLAGVLTPLHEAGVSYQFHLLSHCGHSPFLEIEASSDFYSLMNELIG